jgi:hypothetical protein
MTASTVSANIPRTALCGTCGGTFYPPALSTGAPCGKCEQAAQDAQSAAQRDAYGVMSTTGTHTA